MDSGSCIKVDVGEVGAVCRQSVLGWLWVLQWWQAVHGCRPGECKVLGGGSLVVSWCWGRRMGVGGCRVCVGEPGGKGRWLGSCGPVVQYGWPVGP